MSINFTKMHGVGNDFIVINCINQNFKITSEIAKALAHRNFGIGADQILLVEKTNNPNADFKYRIFNSNGDEVENCGNGARCFVKFIHENQISTKNPILAEIKNGIITLCENNDGSITVDMGKPSFDPRSLPFDTHNLEYFQQGMETIWNLDIKNNIVPISILSISNPHAVTIVENINNELVANIGPQIEAHIRFPKKVNVGFMQISDRNNIFLRVYERGAGETLACGTGSCAAVVSGIRRGLLESPVKVHARGGELVINWDGNTIKMTGEASFVFNGQISIENLLKENRKNKLL